MMPEAPALHGTDAGLPRERPIAGARRALLLLLTINLFNYIDRYVLASTLPDIERAFPSHALGDLALAFMVSYMVLAPLFGWLADRWSRWWLIGLAVIAWSFASSGSGLASSFIVLFATRCLVGVGEAAYGPVAPTLISDLYPERHRGQVLSWFYMAIPVGTALGYAWGGLMRGIGPEGWRWAFYLVAPPGVLLGILCLFMPEPPRGQADPGGVTRRHARLGDYRALARTPSYVLDTLGMTAMTFAAGGISYWMPYYIEIYRQQPNPGQINTIFGLIVLSTGLVATLLGGLAGDRLRGRFGGAYFLVSGGGMLVAFPFFLAFLYAPFPWAWVFLALTCFWLFFNTGPSNTILANVTHPSIRATGFAVNIFIIHALGDAFSPRILEAIARRTGTDGHNNWNAAFQFVSAVILLGAALWLWGARYLKRDTERAATQIRADGETTDAGR